MISKKKLLQLARKWQRVAAIGRKRISSGRTTYRKCSGNSNKAPVTKKGYFAVYSMDGRRIEIPVSYLDNGVIRDLFAIVEEEFGITSYGPIVLPLDAASMEYLILLIRRGIASEIEKASLLSLARCGSHFVAGMAPAGQKIHVCS